ncbi:MAG: hypothetical protein KZQ62_09570, partial [Candidatus Thiodiazotropha sp. (ex Lucinoma aequizonata)]|nr:hypothetical protein [Candidatus Thiodiazotropha sp. (ex Lucinoma aequizonata)]
TCGARLVEVVPLALVSRGMTQVVKVGNRDMREVLKTGIPMDAIHSFTELFRSGSTGRVMQFIEFCQQLRILGCVIKLEAHHRALVALNLSCLTVLGYQPGYRLA